MEKTSKYHWAMPIIVLLIMNTLQEIDGGYSLGHIVLDDHNIQDHHLDYIIEWCNESENRDAPDRFVVIAIMEYMKLLTVEQRELLFMMMDDGQCTPGYMSQALFDAWYERFVEDIEMDRDTFESLSDDFSVLSHMTNSYCAEIKMKAPNAIRAILKG